MGNLIEIIVLCIIVIFLIAYTLLYRYVKKKANNKSDLVDVLFCVFIAIMTFGIKFIIYYIEIRDTFESTIGFTSIFSYFCRSIYDTIGGLTFEGLTFGSSEIGGGAISLAYHILTLYAGVFFLYIVSGKLNYEFRSKLKQLRSERSKDIYIFSSLTKNSLILAENIKEYYKKPDLKTKRKKKCKIVFAGSHLPVYDRKNELCAEVEANRFIYSSFRKEYKSIPLSKILSLTNCNYYNGHKFSVFAFEENERNVPQEEENLDIVFTDIRSHIGDIIKRYGKAIEKYKNNPKKLIKIFKKENREKMLSKYNRLSIDYYLYTKRDVNYEVYQNYLNEQQKEIDKAINEQLIIVFNKYLLNIYKTEFYKVLIENKVHHHSVFDEFIGIIEDNCNKYQFKSPTDINNLLISYLLETGKLGSFTSIKSKDNTTNQGNIFNYFSNENNFKGIIKQSDILVCVFNYFQIHIINESNLIARSFIEKVNHDEYFQKEKKDKKEEKEKTKEKSLLSLINILGNDSRTVSNEYKAYVLGFGEIGQALMENVYIHTAYVDEDGNPSKFSAVCFDENMEEKKGLYSRERPYFKFCKNNVDANINDDKVNSLIKQCEDLLKFLDNNNSIFTIDKMKEQFLEVYELLESIKEVNHIDDFKELERLSKGKSSDAFIQVKESCKSKISLLLVSLQSVVSKGSTSNGNNNIHAKYRKALDNALKIQQTNYKLIGEFCDYLSKKVDLVKEDNEIRSKNNTKDKIYAFYNEKKEFTPFLSDIGIKEDKEDDFTFFQSPFTKLFFTQSCNLLGINNISKDCEELIQKYKNKQHDYANPSIIKNTNTNFNYSKNDCFGLPKISYESLSCLGTDFIKRLDELTGRINVNGNRSNLDESNTITYPNMFIIALGDDYSNIKLANVLLDDIREELLTDTNNNNLNSGFTQIIVINIREKENEKLVRWTAKDNKNYPNVRLVIVGNTMELFTYEKVIDCELAKKHNYIYQVLYDTMEDARNKTSASDLGDIINYLAKAYKNDIDCSNSLRAYLAAFSETLGELKNNNLDGKTDELAAEIMNYVSKNEPYTQKITDQLWDALSIFDKESNIKSIEFLPVHNYIFSQLDKVKDNNKYCKLFRNLTAIEHQRWMRLHFVNGWRVGFGYSNNGILQRKDKENKYHDCLVPIEKVPSSKVLFDIIPAVLLFYFSKVEIEASDKLNNKGNNSNNR